MGPSISGRWCGGLLEVSKCFSCFDEFTDMPECQKVHVFIVKSQGSNYWLFKRPRPLTMVKKSLQNCWGSNPQMCSTYDSYFKIFVNGLILLEHVAYISMYVKNDPKQHYHKAFVSFIFKFGCYILQTEYVLRTLYSYKYITRSTSACGLTSHTPSDFLPTTVSLYSQNVQRPLSVKPPFLLPIQNTWTEYVENVRALLP